MRVAKSPLQTDAPNRLTHRIGRSVLAATRALILVVLVGWATLAIYYSNLPWSWVLAAAFLGFSVWALWLTKRSHMSWAFAGLFVAVAELALGARFPARLLRAVERCGDNADGVANVGIHWATEQCGDLLENNVRGIHFYTLNKSDATRRIYANLGVEDSLALRAR